MRHPNRTRCREHSAHYDPFGGDRMKKRFLAPYAILTVLVLLTGAAAGLAISEHASQESVRVSFLKAWQMPGSWRPYSLPAAALDQGVTRAGHTFAPGYGGAVTGTRCICGPTGIELHRRVRAVREPARSVSRSNIQVCSHAKVVHVGSRTPQLHQLATTRLVSLYVATGKVYTSDGPTAATEYIAIAETDRGVLAAVATRPTSTTSGLVRVTGALVLAALIQADPHALAGLSLQSLRSAGIGASG